MVVITLITIVGTAHITTAGTVHGLLGATHGTILGMIHGIHHATIMDGAIADHGAMVATTVVIMVATGMGTMDTIATGMGTTMVGIAAATKGATTIPMVEAVADITTALWQIASMAVRSALESRHV